MTTLLAIDGYNYNSLPITRLRYSNMILDGPGTGRMSADLWPMHREPQGNIENAYLEIWLTTTKSTDPNFTRLIRDLKSFGSVPFRQVTFLTPLGELTQPMYGASFELELVNVRLNGVSYWGILPIEFIAKQGR